MAINPIHPLGPAYDLLDNILAEQKARHLQVLREAGAEVHDESDELRVIHDPNQRAIFEPAPLVTTDDDKIVAALTNAIETEPWRFAERFLLLERSHALLSGEVDKLRETVTRLSYWSH